MIDVEWLDISASVFPPLFTHIGFVLIFNEHAGFKVYAGMSIHGNSPDENAKFIYENGTKIPFNWAWGIWGKRMETEWMHRHLADYDEVKNIIRYDGVNHEIRK